MHDILYINYFLYDRLEAYKRNQNFQPPILNSLPEPLAVGWPSTGFHQLQRDHKIILPKLTTEQMESYFLYRMAGNTNVYYSFVN